MKNHAHYTALGVMLATAPLFAHHAAEGIVDDDVYAMIDEMVADTPHAELDFTDMADGSTEIALTTGAVRTLENMIDDGLLDYAAMLEGDVTMTIDFDDIGGATATITQTE